MGEREEGGRRGERGGGGGGPGEGKGAREAQMIYTVLIYVRRGRAHGAS